MSGPNVPRRSAGVGVACLVMLLAHVGPAHAAPPAPDCRGPGASDTVLPLPPSLVGEVNAAFGVRMPPAEVVRQTVIRCHRGAVLACMTGANLNCGKADTRRASAGGDAWCRTNPNAAFIPMFATGHATIYAWRCAGSRAVAVRQVEALDADGYVTRNWKRLGGR